MTSGLNAHMVWGSTVTMSVLRLMSGFVPGLIRLEGRMTTVCDCLIGFSGLLKGLAMSVVSVTWTIIDGKEIPDSVTLVLASGLKVTYR